MDENLQSTVNAERSTEKGLTCVPMGSVLTTKYSNQMSQDEEGHVYALVAPPHITPIQLGGFPNDATPLTGDRQRYYLRDMLEEIG